MRWKPRLLYMQVLYYILSLTLVAVSPTTSFCSQPLVATVETINGLTRRRIVPFICDRYTEFNVINYFHLR